MKGIARAVFLRLGEAEATVHGVPLEAVHFHEVGRPAAIMNVVATAVGLDYLGIEEVYASPDHLGQGLVHMSHGFHPVPGPATAQLLQGVPVYQTAVTGELTTPIGAAILTAVSRGYGPMPPRTIRAVGYGAGGRESDTPSVLRVVLGE